MLTETRNVVCSMWKIANKLDAKGLAKIVPFIPEGSDIRHTMKGEVLLVLFKIGGFEKYPNDKQVEFLQYVLHAPISKSNKEEYVQTFKSIDNLEFNLLVPFMVLFDKECDTGLAEAYLRFIHNIAIRYMSLSNDIGISDAGNFYSIMKRNQLLIEKGLNTKLDYDPLDFIKDSEARDTMDSLCNLYDKIPIANDKTLNKFLDAFDVLDKKKEETDSDEEKSLKNFVNNFEVTDDEEINVISNEKEANDTSNNKEDRVIDFDRSKRDSEDIEEDLDSLIGLYEVKHQVKSMFNVVQIREECKKRGIVRQPMSYHMAFLGNPGTGKTTVARLIAESYHDMGLLSKGQLVEVSRADLVAGYVGQTALKVKEIIKKAKGGVLFIDEAYALAGEGNDFGSEAIATLIKGMEDNRDDMVVIVAGYPDLMQSFLDSNPGLKSRFSKTIYFPDYSADELTKIFKKYCKENSIKADSKVIDAVRGYFTNETSHKKRNFGNGRAVRNYFEETMVNQANRLRQKDGLTDEQICNIILEDLPKRVMMNKMNYC
ncbi:AAA+-type ATPase, SpoVK/Ycf46/Vps4 family [Lachnospiraceae bacterium NE2001]|nr:AAA+-type ATPase, SpoVK/Ycf46/Vps4 family [Lachnospiraceae bacterium NE2001]